MNKKIVYFVDVVNNNGFIQKCYQSSNYDKILLSAIADSKNSDVDFVQVTRADGDVFNVKYSLIGTYKQGKIIT